METSRSRAPPPVAPRPLPLSTVEIEQQTSQQPSSVQEKSLQILLARQQEFKKLALASKQAGDKTKALEYFKIMKVVAGSLLINCLAFFQVIIF